MSTDLAPPLSKADAEAVMAGRGVPKDQWPEHLHSYWQERVVPYLRGQRGQSYRSALAHYASDYWGGKPPGNPVQYVAGQVLNNSDLGKILNGAIYGVTGGNYKVPEYTPPGPRSLNLGKVLSAGADAAPYMLPVSDIPVVGQAIEGIGNPAARSLARGAAYGVTPGLATSPLAQNVQTLEGRGAPQDLGLAWRQQAQKLPMNLLAGALLNGAFEGAGALGKAGLAKAAERFWPGVKLGPLDFESPGDDEKLLLGASAPKSKPKEPPSRPNSVGGEGQKVPRSVASLAPPWEDTSEARSIPRPPGEGQKGSLDWLMHHTGMEPIKKVAYYTNPRVWSSFEKSAAASGLSDHQIGEMRQYRDKVAALINKWHSEKLPTHEIASRLRKIGAI